MRELYDLTAAQALESAIESVIENNPGMSKKQAKTLVLNALLYNCVIDEICGQVNFLMGKEEEW